jgi:metal iron transporter
MTVKAPQSSARLGLHDDDHDGNEDEGLEHDNYSNMQRERAAYNQSAHTDQETGEPDTEGTKMRNHWATTAFAVLIWFVIAAMNVANLVLLGMGRKDSQ